MAEALILEFSGATRADYDTVNGKLGIDPSRRDADWPKGLLSHAAGAADDGAWVVVETWSSREDQAAFMAGKLGTALHDAGLPAPSRVTWVTLAARTTIVD